MAWGVCGAVFALLGVGLLLSMRNGAFDAESLAVHLALATFSLVGALVATRDPRHRIGRLFLTIGSLWILGFVAEQMTLHEYRSSPPPARGAWIFAWFSEWYWLPFLFMLLVFTLMLFPTGRLPSPRWRPIAWSIGVAATAFTALSAFGRRLTLVRDLRLPNPLGFLPLENVEEGATAGLLVLAVLISLLAAVASLVSRFRSSPEPERQQIKWFTYAALILVVGFVTHGVWEALTGYRLPWVDALLFATLPVSIGIAILRYRLYDIDLVINRTLVYGTLTAFLGAVYVAGVVGLPRLLPLAEDNDLVVAGSTLAVAALFSPLRRRTQAFVDRRFYRRRYDAARTIKAFSQRLRDQVDLDDLVLDLGQVVRDTLQPDQVSVWLRGAER